MLSDAFTAVQAGQTFGDGDNITIGVANGARSAFLHITSLTGAGAGVWEGTAEDVQSLGESGVDWYPLPSLTVNTSGTTRNLPGATITPTDDDVLVADLMGARFARFRRTANSGVGNIWQSAQSLGEVASAAGAGSTITAEQIGFAKQLTPTVGTAAYVAGDVIGGILEFTTINSSTGRPISIESVSVVDKSQQSIPCTLLWFSATPAGGTYTDGSALVFHANDYAKFQGGTRIQETEWTSYPATPTDDFASKNGLATHVALAGTSLFALLIADDAFSLTAGDLIINVNGRQL